MEQKNKPRKWDKKRFVAFMEKQGFYIVLLLCIGTLVGTAVITSNSAGTTPELQPEAEDHAQILPEATTDFPDFSRFITPAPDVAQLPTAASPEEVALARDEEEGAAQAGASEDETLEEATAQADAADAAETPNLVAPVGAQVAMGYAMDALVYSKTLDEWTTHSGVDYAAAEGEPVVAALSGSVESREQDPLMGNVVTLRHPNGYVTVYAGLASLSLVQEGDEVQAGQTIGHVGATAAFEADEGPHLHFEVRHAGQTVDPQALLEPLK